MNTTLKRLLNKRDAAKAEYDKWQGIIDTLTDDVDFAKSLHVDQVKVMNGAKALTSISQNGVKALHQSVGIKKAWESKTPAQRKKWADAIRRGAKKRAVAQRKAKKAAAAASQ